MGSIIPSVSIIILNHNGRRFLNDCFASLGFIDYPKDKYEVIMVDNGSTDDSVRFTAERFPGVRIVRLDKNYGFSKGADIGAGQVRNDYVVFLNNDTMVDAGWLKEMASVITRQAGLIVNSKVVYFHDRNILNIGRGYINSFGSGVCIGAGEDHSLYSGQVFIHHATGCSMMVAKEDFRKIGGFDEDFFAYHEDVDFGWRSWMYGFKIIYCPGSVVYHKSGGTAGAVSAYKTYLITRNTLFYILKNCQLRYLFIMLPANILFDLAAAAFFLFPFRRTGLSYLQSVKISFAIIKGMVSFVPGIPLFLAKRRAIQAKRIVGDGELRKMGLILSVKDSFSNLAINNFKAVKHLVRTGQNGYQEA